MHKPDGTSDPIGDVTVDAETIRSTARAYQEWSGRFNDSGNAVKKVNADAWEGAAAEAFKEKLEVEPKRWFESSDLALEAAHALEYYAHTADWAKREVGAARAEWLQGYDSSQVGANLSADPHVRLAWAQQEQLERLLNLPPEPAYPGDLGADMRARALARANHAKAQLYDAGNEAASVLEAAANDLPINRNFLENAAEFLGGAIDNIVDLWHTATDPAGAVVAMTEQGQLWATNQQAAFDQLWDREGYEKNQWRWAGSMALGLGVGRAGRLSRPLGMPSHVSPGYYRRYQSAGHAPLPGKSGGNEVITVRGEALEITPSIREMASTISPYVMDHLIERHGPDTPYPDPRTTQFPGNWTHDKVFNVIQDVVSDPSSEWTHANDGAAGSFWAPNGRPAKFEVNGFYHYEVNGVDHHMPVRAFVKPYGGGILTGFIPNM